MSSPPAAPTDVQTPAAPVRTQSGRRRHADRAGIDEPSALARSALTFAARCHAGQRRESDGAPFIEHPSEVARLLRDAGCSSVLVVAGLLHDVVEHGDIGLAEVSARFGADVAELVQAVTDDGVGSYRQRKQVLRQRACAASGDATLLFAADKIAEVRELADQVRRERARLGPAARDSRTANRLERFQQMRLEHYRESLRMLKRVAPGHPLVNQLATELANCPLSIRRDATSPTPGDRETALVPTRPKEADA
jgi:(p)ppGpp synthase/HD superfamily hydrolase